MGNRVRHDHVAIAFAVSLEYIFFNHDKLNPMFKRALHLPVNPRESMFLWGPRQTGKTSLLHETYPNSIWYDLLKTDLYVRLHTRPELLREELLAIDTPQIVVIDEVQKVPGILNEVHWLIENTGHRFILCGSSARKVRRGHANLLGGRAVRHELFGLVSKEVGQEFNVIRMVNRGYLPRHYLSGNPETLIRSYVQDYLKEEIAAEGMVRQLPAFANFLNAASLSDGELGNFTTIARDCAVSSPSVKAASRSTSLWVIWKLRSKRREPRVQTPIICMGFEKLRSTTKCAGGFSSRWKIGPGERKRASIFFRRRLLPIDCGTASSFSLNAYKESKRIQ